MSQLKKILLLTVISFILVNCGENLPTGVNTNPNTDTDQPHQNTEPENPEESVENPPPQESDKLTGNVVCYLGASRNNQHCYSTTPIAEISTPGDYRYKNPQGSVRQPQQYKEPYHMLDLDSLDLTANVSPNFQVGEFLARFKGKYGILAPILIDRLQKIRSDLSAAIFVNSGYRSPKYNASVGGAAFSRHMYGDAVDMWSEKKSLTQLKDQCLEKGASFYQLYRTHIHCDWRNSPLHSAFYGPLVGETKVLLHPLANFEFHSNLHLLKGKNIVVVSHPEAEDEGELLYEWTITTDDGVKSMVNYSPELNLNAFGRINSIKVAVGGSAIVYKELK